jgi:hypothetical protein
MPSVGPLSFLEQNTSRRAASIISTLVRRVDHFNYTAQIAWRPSGAIVAQHFCRGFPRFTGTPPANVRAPDGELNRIPNVSSALRITAISSEIQNITTSAGINFTFAESVLSRRHLMKGAILFHKPVLGALSGILLVSASLAQTPQPLPPGPPSNPERPALTPYPSDEDFSFLEDPANRADFWDPLARLGPSRFSLARV